MKTTAPFRNESSLFATAHNTFTKSGRAAIIAASILISDTLPFGRLWYGGPSAASNAIGYAQHRSRSYDAVIRVCDEAGDVIETHERGGEFKRP